MTKSLPVSKRMVFESYLKVVSKDGGAGIDRESIEMFNANMSGNLYKLWNRMTSGSYSPPPVRTVFIPKKQGGLRPLGIPTVSDRIAQGVVKDYLEPSMEAIFHNSSFGYRPGRSAHDALVQCQSNCIQKAWVLDIDIKGFFDNISHSIIMELLGQHTKERWVLMYVERWLKAGVEQEDGSITARTKGTPQGGVLTPRTHPQTLNFLGEYRLKEVNFNYFTKSITFMINGKVTEYGIGKTYQPGLCFIEEGKTSISGDRAFDEEVWCVSNPGVSLCSASQRAERKKGDTGSICGIYCQNTCEVDSQDKKVRKLQRDVYQHSSQSSAGRFFSKEKSWPKKRGKLKYRSPTIGCGSKSSLRFTIFSSQPITKLLKLNIPMMN